jgi:hypothetical protein
MPLKVRVTPPREGGGRVMSSTDASKSKSTPPKTGTDAQLQRMNNLVKSLAKDIPTAGIRSIFNKALKAQGSGSSGRAVSDKDVKTVRKATKKAYGGKTTKGRSKMMGGGKSTKGYARGGRTKK